MGYYTSYSLTWTKGHCDLESSGKLEDALVDNTVGNAVEKSSEMSYALTREGDPNDSTKWYDHEAEMKVFSLAFPGVLFTLSGEGEEAGDIWKKYFRDGKMQICKVVLDYPKFDAKMLK